ncbi:uncharacterized protein LOC121652708 isoform X2 [Melanotaenia boesemani]|uniref:uncharacterized protein LOC121652708 isoform X2 n=1 Tax=Melanotaenia boesemani TaxID=1250792 RepID=UPI001C03DFAB|nr:uncharacterized protein LOC121652708 isoform X2 [Melanotaenia boesemani]
MDPQFLEFLQEQRKLNDTLIAKLIDEKIDCYAVNDMTDEQLMKYVPKIGDRMAIRQYCRREVAVLEGTTSVSKATASLMSKLNDRRNARRSARDFRGEKLAGNLNALKPERAFQMGLFEEDNGRCIQIKERRGGGTRHLKAPKSTTMAELIETGKDLFFPNGKSRLGNVSEFKFTMRDFTEEELDPTTTLSQQYEKRKVRMLRLYLSCKKYECDMTETLDISASNIESENEWTLENESPQAAQQDTAFSDETNKVTDTATSASASWDSVTFFSSDNDMGEEEHIILVTQASVSDDEEVVIGHASLCDGFYELDDTLPLDPVQVESSLRVQNPCQPLKTTKLRLHRGSVFQELNAAFSDGLVSINDCLLEIEMIQPNGSTEKGEDNGGVLRDALSEYWETFIVKCTSGNIIKIPVTRHDMKDVWENIAKVMVLGYNMVKYFPIVLPKPFLSHCLGLEIQDDDLFSSFLETIPSEEKEVAEQATKDLKSVSTTEEWLDFLEAHDVKILVTEANVRKTILEVAHKELVQDPAYIAECWSCVLKELKLPPGGLDEVFSSLTPSPRKVIAMLEHETLNKRESQILDFLKKFIRNCTELRLRKFLRFCTGADLIVAQKIQVRFTDPESIFTRRPTSHTCGCVLEVPNNYASYPELAEEFTNILDANMWVMDIV